MGIRKHKPTTPGRRGSSVADFAEVTKSTPEKALLAPSPRKGGRNVHGRITTRHRGGAQDPGRPPAGGGGGQELGGAPPHHPGGQGGGPHPPAQALRPAHHP